jgi:hypothetical protein
MDHWYRSLRLTGEDAGDGAPSGRRRGREWQLAGRQGQSHRRPGLAADQAMRSPARTGMSSQFSGGASGHAQRGSNAHDGW